MKKIIFFLVLALNAYPQQGITWTDITSTYPSLPSGVKLFKGERTSPPLKAYYFDVDLNNPDIAVRPYITTSIATVPQLCASFGAYGAVNGGFFGGTASYSAVVYPEGVKAKNVASVTRNSIGYPLMRSFFAIKNNLSMAVDWIYHFGNNKTDIYKFSAPMPYIYNDPNPLPPPQPSQGTAYNDLAAGIGGAPTLVKNGQVHITYNEEIMWGSGVGTDPDPRTGIGYTANKHAILLVADGRLTVSSGLSLSEMANIFISLGCMEAMNLDGGGSSQMAVGNQAVNITATRQVPTILAIVHRDSLDIPPVPVFEKIIDTGDSLSCTVTGTHWTASGIPGFWGNTPTIRNPKGDGSEYVTFSPGLSVSAEYRILGWWTAAVDRCKDTPFIIKHKNGTDTVRVDQTIGSGQWNPVGGNYVFSADATDKVIISNAASVGTYVVADAIKIISFDTATIVSVQEEDVSVPGDYVLYQNYPNPFNPGTAISFSIPENSPVTLKIYDLLGREIDFLLNEYKNKGYHTVSFDAGNKDLSSGMYIYQLRAGRKVLQGKMVYIK